jgi:hypothetical protein
MTDADAGGAAAEQDGPFSLVLVFDERSEVKALSSKNCLVREPW